LRGSEGNGDRAGARYGQRRIVAPQCGGRADRRTVRTQKAIDPMMMGRRLSAAWIAVTDRARVGEEDGKLLIGRQLDASIRRREAEGHLRHQRKHGGK
jgi:hypothetical protein